MRSSLHFQRADAMSKSSAFFGGTASLMPGKTFRSLLSDRDELRRSMTLTLPAHVRTNTFPLQATAGILDKCFMPP